MLTHLLQALTKETACATFRRWNVPRSSSTGTVESLESDMSRSRGMTKGAGVGLTHEVPNEKEARLSSTFSLWSRLRHGKETRDVCIDFIDATSHSFHVAVSTLHIVVEPVHVSDRG